jgi:hypothetical protein
VIPSTSRYQPLSKHKKPDQNSNDSNIKQECPQHPNSAKRPKSLSTHPSPKPTKSVNDNNKNNPPTASPVLQTQQVLH